jgi:hypothetical protein
MTGFLMDALRGWFSNTTTSTLSKDKAELSQVPKVSTTITIVSKLNILCTQSTQCITIDWDMEGMMEGGRWKEEEGGVTFLH